MIRSIIRASALSQKQPAAFARVPANSAFVLSAPSKALFSTKSQDSTERDVDSSAMDSFSANLGIKFQNPTTLYQALTHISFRHGSVPNNERFEFIGDRVISMFVAEKLYHETPKKAGGLMAADLISSVSNTRFAKVARQIGLQKVVRWHPADKDLKGEDKVIADGFEALVGAIYVDQGPKAARSFVSKYVL